MNTKRILKILHVFAWIALIGLSIKAGAIIISYLISLGNEEVAKDLYEGMNLIAYKQNSLVHYSIIVGYRIIQFSIQAYIAFLVVKLLSNLNINKPFNANALKWMQTISYSLLLMWAIVVAHNIHVGILEATQGIKATLIPSEFVLIAGIVYVFSLLFKRGLELQYENDLTI
ncbi:DUF2975 domain-containing protein [Pontimicrobium aquaticum]|uniref:DUF2975 domain-containing protein n=1 Tax=Pontimicrobium aquaticum TaxID=2565367 RepID=A0A4U0F138_9FLAO|nr:DUF2975 domain-containing protein [Pontimicrobium aquaticum]TJY38127.1 DUF2975 domain-containing protein [Pontimicrobium aquaticum]